jgi:large subunit ribosomal protein L15
MKLHHLKPAEGAKRSRRRVGRGRAGVRGKTAGRGTKGWGARHTPKLGFEGGQMPLQRRVPKLKGFRNPTRTDYAVINVERLGTAFEAGAEVTPEALRERGLVGKTLPVKVLGRGELDRALTVHAHAISATARAKIEQAGGTVQLVDSR